MSKLTKHVRAEQRKKKKTSQSSSLTSCKTSNLSKSKKRDYKAYNRQGR